MPRVPSAWIRVPISAEPSILSKRARSTLRILPFKGRIAWKRRSRPCFAEPPALSPSTMKISLLAGSRSWQSASLPGRLAMSSAPLRRVRSRALRAASRAAAASTTLATTFLASDGCSSNHCWSLSPTIPSMTGRTSDETSLSLVCDENLGSGILIDRMQVRPSRMSSLLERDLCPSCCRRCRWRRHVDRAGQRGAEPGEMRCRVIALRDVVGKTQHRSSVGTSRSIPSRFRDRCSSRSPPIAIAGECSACFDRSRYSTKAWRPPS